MDPLPSCFTNFLLECCAPIQECIASSSPSLRKTIVLHCRGLQPREPDPSVREQYTAQSPEPLSNLFAHLPDQQRHDLGYLFDDLVTSPVTSGLIINMCRELPLPSALIDQFKNEAVTKEYLVHSSERRDATIDWSPLFNGLPYPIHPYVPCKPMAHIQCAKIIDRWMRKISVSDTRLWTLPPYSKKRPSSHASIDLLQGEHGSAPSSDEYVIGDLEQRFHWKRRRVTGASEGKVKWTPADLKPRMYYAIGGDQFTSAESRDLLLDLQQQFVFVGNKTRVDPSRLNIGSHDVAIAYDLSSFSSNLSEVQNFIEQLAHHADVKRATVMRADPYDGIVRVPLSEVLRNLASCHDHPEYSLPFDKTKELHVAGQAGFLGTYSNITISTLLHGLYVFAMRGDPDSFNTAGDDGLILLHGDEIDDTIGQLQVLGTLSWEKVWTLPRGSGPIISLKRPLYFKVTELEEGEIQEALYSPIVPSFPTLSYFLPKNPAYTFFNVRNDLTKPATFYATAIKDVTRYLRDISNCELTPLDVDVVHAFLTGLYHFFSLPFGGALRFTKYGRTFVIPMISDRAWVNVNPIDNIIGTHPAPVSYISEVFDAIPMTMEMYDMDVFECNSSSYLAYLVGMGYFIRERLTEITLFESSNHARSFLRRQFRLVFAEEEEIRKPVYRFLSIVSVPGNLRFVSGEVRSVSVSIDVDSTSIFHTM